MAAVTAGKQQMQPHDPDPQQDDPSVDDSASQHGWSQVAC